MERTLYNANWLTPDHQAFAESSNRFFEAELLPSMVRWRQNGQVDREFWRSAGAIGLLGASAPVEFGGSGCPRSFDAVTLYQQNKFGDTSWGFSVHNFVMHYVAQYGTAEQRARWLPGLISGEIIPAIAMTEPGTGSDLKAIRTTATKCEKGYLVNGSKTFISNGQLADLVCLVARTEHTGSAREISLIMVETADAEGFRRGRNLEKIGLHGQDTSELFFDEVIVPADNLLGGKPGHGFRQLMEQLAWERLSVGIMALGACDYAIDTTLDHVQDRRAFDKRLFDFQNVRFKLAEAKTKLEVTRAFIDQCIEKIDAGGLDPSTAAMAKWWSSQTQCEIVDECLQLFGGYGYMTEYPISQLFIDARVQKIYGGSNEIMKELIARSMER
ncbi:MAG: acyl-CoA dehydrogenase family protein [Henriciella sp.]|nr:acyl-CoA dehydrogenase family protein [Henriciella sp.]